MYPWRSGVTSLSRNSHTPQTGKEQMPLGSHQWWKIAGLVAALLIVVVVVVASFVDEPLRQYLEGEANQRLPGYHVMIGSVDTHPLTLSVDVEDVVVTQEANPEPALLLVPRLSIDARLGPLLSGTLAANIHIEKPVISANRTQVDHVTKEAPQETQVAWQDLIRQMTAFRLALSIENGELRYEGPPAAQPIVVDGINLRVEHLTNRSDDKEPYPASVHAEARLLQEAQVTLNGHADFLARPNPAVDVDLSVKNLHLDKAFSAAGRSDLPLKAGIIEVVGHVEYAADKQSMTLRDVTLHHPKIEYIFEPKPVEPNTKPWQDWATELFPVTIERFALQDGEVLYRHGASADPVRMQDLNVTIAPVRNAEAKPGHYPSELRVRAHVSDTASIEADGHADLLAKPLPGVNMTVKIQDLPLESLASVARSYNVHISQGAFGMRGRVKYSSKETVVAVEQFLLDGVKADYVHAAQTKEREKAHVQAAAQKASEAHQDPRVTVKVEHGKIVNSEVGFVNKAARKDYRVFMADMSLDMDHFSNRLEEGTGIVKLTGKFMGSGPTVVSGKFRPEKPKPDFDLEVKIIKTKVKSMNDLLRAYGDIDTTAGLFAFFSELSVKNDHVDGYVKPLLKDVEVYDPKQDQDKAVTQRVYEAVVGGVLGVLENAPRNEVATQTDVSGPVENPHANTWQVVGNLIQNAFFKAILPGFKQGHVG